MKEIDIEIKYEEIALFEEKLGSYKAEKMILDVGGEKVELRPIGTILIAAKGRIDIEGPRGKVKIVLVPQDADGPMISGRIVIPEAELKKELDDIRKSAKPIQWTWKIATPPPNIKYINLNKDTFSDRLLEVVGAD